MSGMSKPKLNSPPVNQPGVGPLGDRGKGEMWGYGIGGQGDREDGGWRELRVRVCVLQMADWVLALS